MTHALDVTPAMYTQIPHPRFQGNPLIEALPAALTTEQISERVRYMPTITAEDRLAPNFVRLALVEEINFAYQASPQLIRLYHETYSKLLQGYSQRNPLSPRTQRFLYELSESQPQTPLWNQTTANVFLFIGPSGFGKTTTIANLCYLFPSVIQHSTYRDQSMVLLQPVILRVDCPSSGSKVELINSIWSAIDGAIGTDYAEQYKSASWDTVNVQKMLSLACSTQCIGMIIVDEVQNLHLSDSSPTKATPRFLEELFNRISIPVLLVGTWQTVPLLSSTFKTLRRTAGDSPMVEVPYRADDPYWRKLTESLWNLQYCHHFTPLTEELYDYIYFCTAGLPALLKRLIKAANKLAILSGYETIDKDLLAGVYENEFVALHKALYCLRNGDAGSFEDLSRPEQILSSAMTLVDDEEFA